MYCCDRTDYLETLIPLKLNNQKSLGREDLKRDPYTSRNLECNKIAYQISGERVGSLINIRKISYIFGRNYKNTKKLYRKLC